MIIIGRRKRKKVAKQASGDAAAQRWCAKPASAG